MTATFAPTELVEQSQALLGVPRHVAAGGLFGQTDPLSVHTTL